MRYVDGYPADPYPHEIDKRFILKQCECQEGVIFYAKHIPTGDIYCLCTECGVLYKTAEDALNNKPMSVEERHSLCEPYNKGFYDVFTVAGDDDAIKKPYVVLPTEESVPLRERFINSFVDTKTKRYISDFMPMLSDTLLSAESKIVKYGDILNYLSGLNKEIYLMWDIIPEDEFGNVIQTYWKEKFQKCDYYNRSVLKLNSKKAAEFLSPAEKFVDILPWDVYLFDESFSWYFAIHHHFWKDIVKDENRICYSNLRLSSFVNSDDELFKDRNLIYWEDESLSVVRKYRPFKLGWDHEHCDFCFKEISQHETFDWYPWGYCQSDAEMSKQSWCCPDCFEKFAHSFGWTVKKWSSQYPCEYEKINFFKIPVQCEFCMAKISNEADSVNEAYKTTTPHGEIRYVCPQCYEEYVKAGF